MKALKHFLPSYPAFMGLTFTGMAMAFFYWLNIPEAAWLFLVFGMFMLAIDCICDAIRADKHVYHVHLNVPSTEETGETE